MHAFIHSGEGKKERGRKQGQQRHPSSSSSGLQIGNRKLAGAGRAGAEEKERTYIIYIIYTYMHARRHQDRSPTKKKVKQVGSSIYVLLQPAILVNNKQTM